MAGTTDHGLRLSLMHKAEGGIWTQLQTEADYSIINKLTKQLCTSGLVIHFVHMPNMVFHTCNLSIPNADAGNRKLKVILI